jgi:hypothetical protein
MNRLVALLALALVLSGCAASSGASPASNSRGGGSSEVVAAGESIPDAAAISGLVLDDSQLPVAGAIVGILQLSLQAQTDANGAYRFTNIAPGAYTLVAAALGFDSASKRIILEPNAEVSQVFTLVAIRIEVPYHEINGPYDGFFTCKLGLPTQSAACGSILLISFRTDDILWAGDRAFQWYNMTSDNYRTVIGELVWTQGTAATSTLLRTSFSHERFGSHWFCAAEGASPLQFRFEKQSRSEAPVCDTGNQGGQREPVEPEFGKQLVTGFRVPFGRVGTNVPHDAPAYLAFQQRVTSYVSIFYGETPIDTWHARPDA